MVARENYMSLNETILYPKGNIMSNPEPKPEVIDTEAARSRTRAFVARHKPKLVGTAITLGSAALFVAGRRSKDVVESVDIDVKTPDRTED